MFETAPVKPISSAPAAGQGVPVPSSRSLRRLDWLNFFLADVQTGVGPFLAIYLAKFGWNEQLVGTALSVGGLAGIIAQTPAGALVDRLRSKRALIAMAVVAFSRSLPCGRCAASRLKRSITIWREELTAVQNPAAVTQSLVAHCIRCATHPRIWISSQHSCGCAGHSVFLYAGNQADTRPKRELNAHHWFAVLFEHFHDFRLVRSP